jgi:diazepam-binding inhibitor (GABA receptor modulator, acyl-CoA-binding protein)
VCKFITARWGTSFSALELLDMTASSSPNYSAHMALTDDFSAAQERLKRLAHTPVPDELLQVYALYKQATLGDIDGTRPGMLDFKARAKFDAWEALRGKDAESAMQEYVSLVTRLAEKYG